MFMPKKFMLKCKLVLTIDSWKIFQKGQKCELGMIWSSLGINEKTWGWSLKCSTHIDRQHPSMIHFSLVGTIGAIFVFSEMW